MRAGFKLTYMHARPSTHPRRFSLTRNVHSRAITPSTSSDSSRVSSRFNAIQQLHARPVIRFKVNVRYPVVLHAQPHQAVQILEALQNCDHVPIRLQFPEVIMWLNNVKELSTSCIPQVAFRASSCAETPSATPHSPHPYRSGPHVPDSPS